MLFPSLLITLAWTASAKPMAYDQRQTGDVNVQIHLKDLQVVALIDTEALEDYMDYNYSYDYSDFTIKPMKPSTNSGSSTTASAWHTWPTNPASSSSKANSTEELPPGVTTPTSGNVFTTTPSPGESDAELIAPVDIPSSSAAPEASGSPGDELDETVQGTGSKSRSPGGCQAGYYTDARGRCKKGSRRRVSFLPFALRMLPKRLGTQRST